MPCFNFLRALSGDGQPDPFLEQAAAELADEAEDDDA